MSMVDRGDFESIVEPILTTMKAIAEETGYQVILPGNPSGPPRVECSPAYELKAVLMSMLLIAEKLLLAITLNLGCDDVRSDIIKGDFSFRPLVYPRAWTRKGQLRPDPVTPTLATDCLDILSRLIPPRLASYLSFLIGGETQYVDVVGPQIEYLDTLLTDEIFTIFRYFRAANGDEFERYREDILAHCVTPDSQVVFDPDRRLEVLLVEISRSYELSRAIKNIRTRAPKTPIRLYLAFLLAYSIGRSVSHSEKDLIIWEPDSLSEFKKWSQSIEDLNESAIAAFVSVTIPANKVPQPDILWDSWAEHIAYIDDDDFMSLDFFCSLCYVVWIVSMRSDRAQRFLEVGAKLTAILPAVLQAVEERPKVINNLGIYLFMSKFSPDLFHRQFVDKVLQRSPQFQNIFLRTLHEAHDSCSPEQFIRIFRKCEHVLIELLCRYADTGWGTVWAKQNLKYGLDLLTRTPEVTRAVKKSNLTALASALMSLMCSKGGDLMQARSIEFMVAVLDSGAASGAFLDTLQDMLSSLLDREARKLLDPQCSLNDIDVLRYLLELRLESIKGRAINQYKSETDRDQELRCGLLIRICIDQNGPETALTCLRILQSAPVYTEDMDFVAQFVVQQEGALNTAVHVRKRLAHLVALQDRPIQILVELFYSLRRFFRLGLEGSIPFNITTAIARMIASCISLILATSDLRSPHRVEAEKTVIDLFSMAFSPHECLRSLFESVWGARIRLKPVSALAFIRIIRDDFIEPFDPEISRVEGLACIAGVLSWLVDIARECKNLDVDLFEIVEKVVCQLTHSRISQRAILPALKLTEIVGKHHDLVPRHKALGLKLAVEAILSHCQDPELRMPSLTALRSVFQDYSLSVTALGNAEVDTLRALLDRLESLEKESKQPEVSLLAKECVTALCAANLDAAFIVCQDLKHRPKPWLRACIFDILSFTFVDELGELLYESRHATLVQYLMSHHDVFLAFCETCSPAEVSDFSDGVRCLWASRGREIELAEFVAGAMISQANEGWELFRHNSTLARIYMDILRGYLRNSLTSAFTPIHHKISGTDPCPNAVADILVQKIGEMSGSLPIPARKLLGFIREKVATKFPGFEYPILRTIILLRIVCPFILVPAIENPSSKTAILLRSVASHITKIELPVLVPMLDAWSENTDSVIATTGHSVPNEDYLSESGHNVHLILHRHAPEILHVLRAKGLPGEHFLHTIRALGPPGKPTTKMPSRTIRRRQRDPASLGQFKGAPCKYSSATAALELRPDIPSEIYWFNRIFRAAMAKTDGSLFTFSDHTACLVGRDMWSKYLDALCKYLSAEFLARWDEAVVFNLPFDLALNCPMPPREIIPIILKTSEDFTLEDLSMLDMPEDNREVVREIGLSQVFLDVSVVACSLEAPFKVYLGNRWIQFVHRFDFGCSSDAFHVEDIREDGALVRGRNVFKIPPWLQALVTDKKQQSLSENRKTSVTGPAFATPQAPGILFFLCLLDLCSTSPQARGSAFRLLTMLPERVGLTIKCPPWGPHQLFISSVVEISSSSATLNPGLSESFLETFVDLAENSNETTVSTGARIAVPWLPTLSQHPDCDTIMMRLLRVTSSHRSLVEYIWPVILSDPKLAPRMLDAIVTSISEDHPVEGLFQAAAAHPAVNGTQYLLGRLYSMLSGDVLYIDHRWWSTHPDWSEIEAVILLLSYLVVANDTGFLADFSFLILVFAGVGSHRLRAALHRICTNIAASKLAMANRQNSLFARLSALLHELTSQKGHVLFGVQSQMIDWTCDSCSDFSQDQADLLAKLIGELCTAVSPSYVEFNRVRKDTYYLLVRFLGPTFPALQRRCILGLHGICRFQMPDRIPATLLNELSRIMESSVDSDVAGLYLDAFLHTLGDTVECLSDHTLYAARFFWLAVAVLSTGNRSLMRNAFVLVQRCLKIMDSWGAFYNRTVEETLITAKPKALDDWFMRNHDLGFLVMPRGSSSFHAVLAELLVIGLQSTVSQSVALDVCETILNICDPKDERNFAYMLFIYLTSQNMGMIINLPFFNNFQNDLSVVDAGGLLQTCSDELANIASSGSENVLLALLQGCKISGLTQNMQFAFAGPRLLDMVCKIKHRKTIQTIAPLLRPTLHRLLQLEEPEVNRRLVQWTLVVFARDASEREQLPELLKNIQRVIFNYKLRSCVDEKYNLHPVPIIKQLTQKHSAALADFVALLC